MGFDRHFGVWIKSGQGHWIYYWNAEQHKWDPLKLEVEQRITGFYGGPDSGLYATQHGDMQHWGNVYSLDKGKMELVTRYYFKASNEHAGFQVLRDGRFLNWGGETLRIFDDGQWIEEPVSLPQKGPLVFEHPQGISIFTQKKSYNLDYSNNLSLVDLTSELDFENVRVTQWGGSRAIFIDYGRPQMKAFELTTGRQVDTETINQSLGDRSLYDLFSTRDGSVWIAAYDRELESDVFFRISQDGSITRICETTGFRWKNYSFATNSRRVLQDKTGKLWFAIHDVGLITLENQKAQMLDVRVDNNPIDCISLMEGQDGAIYCGTFHGLYVYHRGESITGQPHQKIIPLKKPSQTVWKYEPKDNRRIKKAWLAKDLILYSTWERDQVVALDSRTGQKKYTIAVPKSWGMWTTSGSSEDELIISTGDHILSVDRITGTVRKTLPLKHDRRIEPVVIDDDYIVADDYRSNTLLRQTLSGSTKWSSNLPGYVMRHLSASESFLIIQTRGSSYGGQKTLALDPHSGQQLWSDTLNAYGSGTALSGDGLYCVETDTYLNPKKTEAWVIARNPDIGERLWHFRRAESSVSHAPIIDDRSGRVYVILENTVICLDLAKGNIIWETELPRTGLRAPAASYDPYHSCMRIAGGQLLVADITQTLYFLDLETGDIRKRMAVTDNIIRHDKKVGVTPLLVTPWLVDDTLIASTPNGIYAYKLVE